MALDEQSEAHQGGITSMIDGRTLATGALVALVSTVVALFGANQVRQTEVEQLRGDVAHLQQTLDDKLDGLATQEDVEKAKAEAIEKATSDAHSYTDNAVSQLQPILSRQTSVLERLDEDRRDARQDRRKLREELSEVRTQLTRISPE